MNLEILERDLSEHKALGRFDSDYLHRATRETSLDLLHGRATLLEDTLADLVLLRDQRIVSVLALPELVAAQVEAKFGDAGRSTLFRRHRWLRIEGNRVAAEVLITDTGAIHGDALAAHAKMIACDRLAHPPLGELRSGQGQRGASSQATLTTEPPPTARALCDGLHQIWNGRQFDRLEHVYAQSLTWNGPGGRTGGRNALGAWLLDLLADLPDATWIIDRWCADDAHLALRWRLFAHHVRPAFGLDATGRRLRLIGSTVLRLQDNMVIADNTVLDEAALLVQLHERQIFL